MPQRTNPFQQLTASILATVHAPDYIVEESVLEINNKTGLPREIDIKITEKANPKNKILVECRDHKRKQDVIWIDGLAGKARSLGFKKVIAVSSSGFYNTAIKEAASRGIKTLQLKEAEEIEWKKWLFSISEFGLNIDFEPTVKNIQFITPNTIGKLSIKGIPPKDLFFVNLNTKTKISLLDYIQGMVKDPKIVNYVRENNTDNAISHYDYEIPCDPGIGLGLPGDKFVPIIKMIFSLDSVRRSEKVMLNHILIDGKRILTGNPRITGSNSRLVLEERPGQLVVIIEQRKMIQGHK